MCVARSLFPNATSSDFFSNIAEYPAKDADILDEAIALFRANVLFRKFDIHGE